MGASLDSGDPPGHQLPGVQGIHSDVPYVPAGQSAVHVGSAWPPEQQTPASGSNNAAKSNIPS